MPQRVPQQEIDRIKSEISLQRLVEASGIELERHGADLRGLCPFHEDNDPSLVITPKKNIWHDRDKESGLDYAMARMYANTGGRFTSPDKGRMMLNLPSTLNRYAYGGSDPINHVDPSGDSWILTWARVTDRQSIEYRDGLTGYGSLSDACAGIGGYSAGGGGLQVDGRDVWVACYVWVDDLNSSTNTGAGADNETGAGAAGTQTALDAEEMARQMIAAVTRALAALNDPDPIKSANCRSLFGGTADPAQVLTDLLYKKSQYGVIFYQELKDKSATNAAQTQGYITKNMNNGDILGRGAMITINTGPTGFFGRTSDQSAITLLHELGHLWAHAQLGLSDVDTPDGGSFAASDGNSRRVASRCGLKE